MPILTIRPTSTATSVGITSSSGTPHADLSDDSDATVVRANTPSGYVYLGLGDVTLSAGQRVKQVRARVRRARDAADVGRIEEARVRLFTNALGFGPGDLFRAYLGTVVEEQGPWRTTAPGGGAWTEPIIDALNAEILWYDNGSGIYFLRVAELYVDVEANSQPVVTAPTVAGATTTTRPTFTSTYTDADADPMVRGRWKVFSSAQYGASSFNPDTSASVWDSGELAGSSVVVTIGKDLANGGTYKVYFRAAQSWSGPLGSLWWSAWQSSAAFTIVLIPPPSPALTVVAETTLPSYRNRLVATLTGLNILDADTAGDGVGFWIAGANTNAPASSATNPKSGTQSLLLTATAAGSIEAFSGSFATARRIQPGKVVSVTAAFRAVTTGRSSQVGIRFYDAAGGIISTTMGGAVTSTTAGYTVATLTAQTAPANAYAMVVRLLISAAGAGEQHRIDETGILLGSSAAWSPGGAGQAGTVVMQRSQRLSPYLGRGPARNWLHPQLHSSGGLVGTADGFYVRQANDGVRTLPLDRAYPGNPTDASASMIEWAVRVGAFSYLDVGMASGAATDGQDVYAFPAVPGKAMEYGCWAWCETSTRTVRLALVYIDATNAVLGSATLSGIYTLTTTPQLITVSATPPAGTVFARVEVENSSGAANWRYYQVGAYFRPTSEPAEVWPGQAWSFDWETVRGSGTVGQDGDWAVVMYDHEAPPGRPVLYRAQLSTVVATGETVTSTPSTPVHTYLDPPNEPLLKQVLQPENAVVVVRAPDVIARTEDATIIHPLGRDADPVRVTSWRSGDDGRLRIETAGSLELYRLRQLLAPGALLLQHHDGGQTYLLADPASIEELSLMSPLHGIEVGYLQIARPAV